jgi:superkiller protein 3
MLLVLAAALFGAVPSPLDTEARLRAARSALAAGEYQAAKREFRGVLQSDAGNSAAHLGLGIIALVENDPGEGLRHFSAVPGDARALIGRLDCELRLRRMDAARNTVRELDGMTGANPAASEHVGKLLASAGEFGVAARFLRRASSAGAANLLGEVEEKSGNLDEAVQALANAARLDPTNEDYRIDYAAVLVNSGRLEEAVAAFRTAAQEFPSSARVRVGLGSALYLSGHHERAAQALLEAVRLQPAARAFDLLGKAYEAAGNLQPQIRAEFEKYLTSKPTDAAAYAHYAAILHAAGGDAAPARRALACALELEPGLAAAHVQLGVLEQAAGNWSAAVERYQRAAQLDPANASVRYRLAIAHQKLGHRDKAREELSNFQRLKAREKTGSAGISAQP